MYRDKPFIPADTAPLYRTLEPVIAAIERYRRGHLLFMLGAVPLLAVPAGALSSYLATFVFPPGQGVMVAGIVTALVVALTVWRIFDRDYRRHCKRKFNRRIAAAFGFRYEPLGTFNVAEMYPHYILPPFVRCLTEDSIAFFHNERLVEMQEAIFTQGHLFEHHVFNPLTLGGKRGLVIRIAARRAFPVHTVVVPRRAIASDRDRLRFRGLSRYERAPFGNRQFSEKYYVMSVESREAHMIFDPAFIERLLAFEKALNARSLSISFRGSEIAIYADHAHDFLEAGNLLRPVTLRRVDAILEDARLLTGMIDALALNVYTGV
jgi:hypothetical protein